MVDEIVTQKKSRKARALTLPIIGISLVLGLALIAIRVLDPYPVVAAREIGFDLYQRVNPREASDLPVRIVDVDDASLNTLGQWPWPRAQISEIVSRLTELGAAAIAFDVLFAESETIVDQRLANELTIALELEPDQFESAVSTIRTGDELLADSFAQIPVTVGFALMGEDGVDPPKNYPSGFAVIGGLEAERINEIWQVSPIVQELSQAATGIATVSINPADSVGIVRKIPLIWRVGETFAPSLSLEALRSALGVSTVVLFGSEDGTGSLRSARVGDFQFPLTEEGEFWLHFRPYDSDAYVSAADLFLDPLPAGVAEKVAGHIIFVGSSAAGLFDIKGTPLGTNVPGVSLHAQVLEQILSEDFLVRADWVSGLELLVFILLAVVSLVSLSKFGAITALVIGALAAGLVAAFANLMFTRFGILFDATYPLIGGLLFFFAIVALRYFVADSQKRVLRKAFSRYVAPDVLKEIEAAGTDLKLGGENRTLTVLFLDVRNFTRLSESMAPDELITSLNMIFSAFVEEITDQEGVVDKFIGDAIMAFWNAPIDIDRHQEKACRAAIGIRHQLVELNRTYFEQPERGNEAIGVGVGLNTGIACVGNVGSDLRFDYSALGDTVNVASRTEGLTKHCGYDLLVAESTASKAQELAMLYAGTAKMKGRVAPMPIFILLGDETCKSTSAYEELSVLYDELVDDLEDGRCDPELVSRCRELGMQVEPGLSFYFDRIPERIEDFSVRRREPHGEAVQGLAPKARSDNADGADGPAGSAGIDVDPDNASPGAMPAPTGIQVA